MQANFKEIFDRKPMAQTATAISFPEALSKGLITPRKRLSEIDQIIKEDPKPDIYGLRFPEKDGKTDKDYMRISFREEDEEWLEKQKRLQITVKEQKRLQREILTDNWQEDMQLYKNKRKP